MPSVEKKPHTRNLVPVIFTAPPDLVEVITEIAHAKHEGNRSLYLRNLVREDEKKFRKSLTRS